MKDLLRTTRELLSQLGTEVVSIANEYSDVFSDPTINEQLNRFRLAYEEAIANLDSPTFRIATIGTTSSGKSTIINALIGRKVAPMEADEMSAGILTLSSSNESKMIIEEVEGSVWETGEWVGVGDEDLYTHIRDRVMRPYHEKRKLKELPAPQITVLGSLLPVDDPSLLNLPSGVNIEFVDLPGLKSVQDRTNLKVIQKRVNKAFSLVALDYGQVDEQHRKELLGELKKVVKYLQGRTDSMIFILNRVDLRNRGDLPLDERIAKLQLEIQKILSLPKPPDIIPFSSLLLYYAQCAWGTNSQSEASQISANKRSQFLKDMFADCAGTIKQRTQGNRHLRNWFRNIEDGLEEGQSIDDETMRQILQYALDWSGGDQFWSCLRERLSESFPVLVLTPILMGVLEIYKALSSAVETIAQTRQLQTKEQVKEQKRWITQRRKELRIKIEEVHDNFCQNIEQTIEDLKKSDPTKEGDLSSSFQKRGIKGFQSLVDAIREVRDDLDIKLIFPVRDALKNNSPLHELEEKLLKVVNPLLTKEIIKAYDIVSRRLIHFKKSSSSFFKEVREDDQKAVKGLMDDEKAVRKLFQAMRDAITARSEFMLQTQSKKFEGAVQSLVDENIFQLITFCQSNVLIFNLDETIITNFRQSMSDIPLTLPDEKLFDMSAVIKQTTKKKKEVIGTKQETESYESGSCFKETKSRQVTRNVMGDIDYRQLNLPSFDAMAEQWSSGISKGKESLWNSLRDWIIKYMKSSSRAFVLSVNEMLDLVERSLNEQVRVIEDDLENQMQQWEGIQSRMNLITQIHYNLESNLMND
jgi:GTPase SAR1 family protein